MADMRTVRVSSPQEIPFDTIKVGKTYILTNATPDIAAEVLAKLSASPVAIGRRPIVIRNWVHPGEYRVFIGQGKKEPSTPKPVGRPPGGLSHRITKLQVGQSGIELRNGRNAQTIRNICSKTGARHGMRFKAEAIQKGTPVPEVAIDWDALSTGDVFRITRTA